MGASPWRFLFSLSLSLSLVPAAPARPSSLLCAPSSLQSHLLDEGVGVFGVGGGGPGGAGEVQERRRSRRPASQQGTSGAAGRAAQEEGGRHWGMGEQGGGGEGWLPGLLVLLSVCACACVWRRPEGRARRVGVDKWGGRGAASFFFFFRLSLARIAFTRRDCPPWPMHAPRPAAGATAATPPPPTLAPPPPIRIRQARWTDAAAIGRLTAEVRRRREREQKKHALSLAQPPAPGACLSVQGRGRKGERVARAARARTRPRPTRTPTGGCAPHSGVGCHPPFS